MVAIGISEFSFGFAFLIEQVNKYKDKLRHCPFLPNLREETGLGYDAYLPTRGIDFYYQFKIGDYLWSGNAKYLRNGDHTGPYFRFCLENNQHRRLFNLSQNKPYTYYVVPRINRWQLFDEAFIMGTLASRTILIPVRDCPNVHDDESHCITFPSSAPGWKWHSDDKNLDSEISGKDIGSLIENSNKDWKPIDSEFALGLVAKLINLAEQSIDSKKLLFMEKFKNLYSDYPTKDEKYFIYSLLTAARISSCLFGANLVLVGERES